ncbi:MAG: 3-oxoacyl-ACP synthase [Bacteroidota bacterium]|nr:3-oxoacyl-ACP synthase [Bacteroidota bacterium]
MNNPATIKEQILKQISDSLSEKVSDAMHAIASAKESRNNDTKSSAGDKFETGRAMMQMEIDTNEIQLNKSLHQQQELSQIDIRRNYEKVEAGSLVMTNHENYFISIAMGKIIAGDKIFYAISLASPIGMILRNKVRGEKIEFHGRVLEILHIQ